MQAAVLLIYLSMCGQPPESLLYLLAGWTEIRKLIKVGAFCWGGELHTVRFSLV